MEEASSFSPEYIRFWATRGIHNISEFVGEKRPSIGAELAAAEARTVKLLDLLQDPDYETVRDYLASLFAHWMRGGLITPEQHMKLVETHEKITDGETMEEFLARVEAPKTS